MPLEGLLKLIQSTREFRSLLDGIGDKSSNQMIYGLSGSQFSYMAGAIAKSIAKPVLIITQGSLAAKKRVEDLRTFLGDNVYLYPEKELMPFGVVAQSKEILAGRLLVMDKLVRGEAITVVAPVEALTRKILPKEIFRRFTWSIKVGQRAYLENISLNLVNQGYERVSIVEGRGQFSIRGGILDIFPVTQDMPVRTEFFDDEVDSIRIFDIDSQRSLEKIEELIVPPAREIVLPEDLWEKGQKKIEKDYHELDQKLKNIGNREARHNLRERFGEIFEKLTLKVYFEELDHFFTYFYPAKETIINYFPEGSPVLIEEISRVKGVVESNYRDWLDTHVQALESGIGLPGQVENRISHYDFDKVLSEINVIKFSLLPREPGGRKAGNIIHLQGKPVPPFFGHLDMLAAEIKMWRRQNYSIVILAATEIRGLKLLESLKELKLDVFYTGELDYVRPANIVITPGVIDEGFEIPQLKLVVITEAEIYGQKKKIRRFKETDEGIRISKVSDLKPGDYVVHVNHGIGRYMGIHQLEIEGLHKDFLLIKYAGEDKLYVPTEQIGLIQKYLGADAKPPKLYKLGGSEWSRVKNRVKESVRKLAQDLLALYAAREALPGHAFSPDTVWQREFEEAFPYEETPDQLRAIREVKKDMEKPRPMDRLLCGDVGYGKTEVAIRAAFKAVMDNKQVAVLVPTTILAQQHYNTFLGRFKGYPVNIEMISRFRTPKQQKEILKKLGTGGIDIIIGTHRLVQEDVRFKDLGLVIVDEEQRFGVTHKEKLKLLCKNVDVLTLTATPIPRTLHMALVGTRDMSILENPPEDRFPVQTYVVEFNDAVIRDAIRRELGRGGQVFFVHNRVMDIDRVAALIQKLVPEAKIAVAHGQMNEDDLEKIILDFLEGDYDVLVSTTIIEIGLDMPNVNTLIVNMADNFGLSQLYQLRGRVGRSNRIAYAYFTYHRDKVLTEVAQKRLQAIKEFTEFGSGFKIALRDLEIRGAGNILGPEQHGHLISVGFDLYTRLLEEAVNELKGEETKPQIEPTIDIKVDAYIPDTYIDDSRAKIEAYQRIMNIENDNDAADILEELEDRFGDLPEPVEKLIAIARVKALCKSLKIQEISQNQQELVATFLDNHQLKGQHLAFLSGEYRNRLSFSASDKLQIRLKTRGYTGTELLKVLEEMLIKMQGLV